MRLIDADVLTERLNDAIECGRRVDMPTLELEAVLADVQNAPSIDIVRCKECKYAHMTYGGDCKYCDMWKDDDDFCIELYLDGDFYCAFGEREGE